MPPRIAANMMVLNAAAVLPRCLRSVRGAIDELVVVDTGSEDDTRAVVESLAVELKVDRLYYERLHPLGPDFFTDEAESFRQPVPGPHTGRRIPTDWAAVRNRALDETTADYVVKLDADDEALCPPENWKSAAACLEARPDTDVVASVYEVMDGQGSVEWLSMYDRMFRRVPSDGRPRLRWTMSCHEYLKGKNHAYTLYNVSGLRMRDWRDSPGDGVRVPYRNLKVLLRAWEQGERRTISDPRDLAADLVERFTLGHEAVEALPDLSLRMLNHVEQSLDPSDLGMLSDCYYHVGRVHEALSRGRDRSVKDDEAVREAETARGYYTLADDTSPHLQALLRRWSLEREGLSTDRAAATRLKVVSRVGASLDGPQAFNCDLRLLRALRGAP